MRSEGWLCGAAVLLAAVLVTVPPAASAEILPDSCRSASAAGGWCGDGGPATDAGLATPTGVAATADGGFLISDVTNNTVRKVSRDGIIRRIAGIGVAVNSGDGGPAIGAGVDGPTCVTELPSGSVVVQTNVFVGEGLPARPVIRRIGRTGRITTVAGVQACRPAILPGGDRLVVDGSRVLRVSAAGARVVAGIGGCSASTGEGGPAVQARLGSDLAVAALSDGAFLIADADNGIVRRVSPAGVIATVAGRYQLLDASLNICGSAGHDSLLPNYLLLTRPLKAKEKRPLRVSFTNTFAGTCAITITRGAKPGGGRAFGPEFFSCQAGQPSRTIRPRLKARSYWLELVRGSRDASKPPKKDSELLKVSR